MLLWSIHPKLMYGSKHAGQVQFSADWSGIWVSLKLKKTHYFVFCCGQRFVPSIGSIVKASFQLYGQAGSFFALLEISAILLKYLSYFWGWFAYILMGKKVQNQTFCTDITETNRTKHFLLLPWSSEAKKLTFDTSGQWYNYGTAVFYPKITSDYNIVVLLGCTRLIDFTLLIEFIFDLHT